MVVFTVISFLAIVSCVQKWEKICILLHTYTKPLFIIQSLIHLFIEILSSNVILRNLYNDMKLPYLLVSLISFLMGNILKVL